MKKIAITGGKGGTGKSTVAVLMTKKFVEEGKKVVLCDCDVECPNDYLLLGQKLGRPRQKITAEFPQLIKKKCTKCGLCVKACRENAIFQAPGEYPVFIKDLCSSCGACWTVCPFGAIVPEKEEVGQIYVNQIQNDFWLVTGSVNPGLEQTGPAVTQSKKFALQLAKKQKADLLLLDTAPGIHCSVISALIDCNQAYCVTEPTPLGAYDLKLILGLCKKLKLPAKIILNQADLGDKKEVEKIAGIFKAEIEKQIPYSKEIVKAYSQGRLLNLSLEL